MEINGTTAVVTGAGSGIGRALAHAFAAAGARVAVADVEAGALEETAAQLADRGATAIAQVTDVSDADSVHALAARVDAELGGVDILCNNAGVFAGGLIWERPRRDWDWVMGVNFFGIVHGIQAFVPGMIERGRPGHVVNTCSAAGLFPSAFSAPYTASKFAALAVTESLAGELAASGAPIGVTALCPGAVNTGIGHSERNRPDEPPAATESSEFVEQALRDLTERGAPPEDVAALVLDAIRVNRYLQLTHDGYIEALRTRTEELLAGGVPVLPYFD